MIGTLFIIVLSYLISINQKKYSISEIIPSVFLSIIVFLYPFYIINRLRWGRNAIIILFIVLLLFSAYQFYKSGASLYKRVSYIQVIAYLTILLVIVLMTRDNYVWLWDSTRLWGAVPKALYFTERLQLGTNALVYPFMQSYPPGMPLLVYFIESFNNDFYEWQIYLTYGAFVSSLLLPAIRNINRKTISILPILGLLILLIPCISTSNGGDYGYFYNSLFIDPVLGALYGYGIYISAETDYHDFLSTYRLVIVLFSLTLLKDSGTLFAFALFVLSVILHCIRNHFSKTKTELALVLCALVSLVLPWRSWALLLKLNGITNHITGFQHKIDSDVIRALATNSISMPSIQYSSRGEAFCVSASLIIVLFFEILAFYLLSKKTKIYDQKIVKSIIVTILLSFSIFLIGYGFTFGYRLPSFQRYTGTLTIALLVFLFLVFIDYYLKSTAITTHKRAISYSVIYLFSVVLMIDFLYVWEKTTNQAHVCPYESVKQHSDFIIKKVYTEENTSKLDPHNNKELYLMYTGNPKDNCIESQRLYLNLIGSGIRQKNDYLGMQVVDWDTYDSDPSSIDIKDYVQSWDGDIYSCYDYLYVYDIDDRTKKLLLEHTSSDLENHHIYRIDKENHKLIDIGKKKEVDLTT